MVDNAYGSYAHYIKPVYGDNMKEETEYNIEDLMASAIAQKPMDFENVLNSIMLDRITDAIETRKVDIAKTMFDESKEESETEEEIK